MRKYGCLIKAFLFLGQINKVVCLSKRGLQNILLCVYKAGAMITPVQHQKKNLL